ncbi:MAG: hypothetical protein QM784_11615 [Polyangiaceae bacterium]
MGSFSGLFSPLDAKARIYKKLEQPTNVVPVDFPSTALALLDAKNGKDTEPEVPLKSAAPNLQALADRIVLQQFAPVTVLCNDRGNLLYVSRRAGKYLEPAAGKANLNVFAMAREGLRFELSRSFASALRQPGEITVSGVQVGTNGGTQLVDLKVQKLLEPKELRGTVLVVFKEVTSGPQATVHARSHHVSPRARELELEQDLQRAREEDPDDPRRDANLPGRTQIDERRAAKHERRAAKHERRADDLQGGDAVVERRAPDGKP